MEAIVDMPEPNNKEELATFMGIITYLGKFVQNLSAVSTPLCELTQIGVAWSWEAHHQEAFSKIKQCIANAPTLKFYDVQQPFIVSIDASKCSYGAVISQESGPIFYASRCLTQAEINYAPIESELSAVLYGCTRFHDYIFGQKVTVETDHKPLVGIMAKPLYKLSPCIQSMHKKLLWYDINATWKPGKEIFVPDCLSQALAKQAASMQELVVIVEVDNIISQLPVLSEKLQEFRDNTANDADLQLLQNTVMQGWPLKRSKVPEAIRSYFAFRYEIVYCNGLLFQGNQLVVPKAMQADMLSRIHESHQGIDKSKQRARSVLFWPGMNSQRKDIVSQCATYAQLRKA